MSKIITVFGATGQQGGSVIRTILNDPELSKQFKIRGITRDASKPEAQALAKQGVEIRNASLIFHPASNPALTDHLGGPEL